MSSRSLPNKSFASIIRESIPGEYVAMICMLTAACGGICWGARALQAPWGVGLTVASIWIFVRCTGALAGRWSTLLVSTAIVVLVLLVRGAGEIVPDRWLQNGPFAPTVYAVILGMILIVDVVDVWRRTMSELETTDSVSRQKRKLQIVVRLLGLVFVTYMIVVPAVGAVIESHRSQSAMSRNVEDMTLADHIRLRTTEVFFVSMFFVLGSTVGSFVNVVAYRLPRGESLVRQRSRCPSCQSPIAGRDNVPIFGWLILGGRCRACDAPISPRYPIVEFISALLFSTLYFVELISGGANIPLREPNFYHGVVWILFYTKWDLVGFYVYHCFLFCTLLAWTLMHWDGNRIPRWSYLVAILMACIPPVFWPDLHPVPVCRPLPLWIGDNPWGVRLAGPVAGGCLGALLGLIVSQCLRRSRRDERLSLGDDAVPALCLIGVVLGWQAALGITFAALVIHVALRLVARTRPAMGRLPLSGSLLIAAVVHQLLWRLLIGHFTPWWPGPTIAPLPLLSNGLAILFLAILSRVMRDRGVKSLAGDSPRSSAPSFQATMGASSSYPRGDDPC